MKINKTKSSRAFKLAKGVMRSADTYRNGKYTHLSALTKLSFLSCALLIFCALVQDIQWLKALMFVSAAMLFGTATSFLAKKGFLELIDAEYEKKIEPSE